MANKPIPMNKLRQTIRLYVEGRSKQQIALGLSLSRNTVRKYLDRFMDSRLTYEDIKHLSDRELYEKLQLGLDKPHSPRMVALLNFFTYVQKEVKRPGVTLQILWEEYIKLHPDGYSLSQYYEYYKRWRGQYSPSMHIEHKVGDKIFVDYAGKKLHLVDSETGEVLPQEVFVSILGGSQLIFAEASGSQRQEDFITSSENAIHYYGGSPQAIVPDNLKSAVTKSHRYEPTLNEAFQDFAAHYSMIVLPARAYKPKDKALVEGAVKIVYSAIYAPLRNQQFHTLKELNAAIRSELEVLNNRPFRKGKSSRRSLFEELEKSQLRTLPVERYELKEMSWVTVMKSGHVLLQKDKHYYSVPYRFIGKKVKLVWSKSKVQIFYQYERIALHTRTKSKYHYTTEPNHLASSHRFITQWNPEYFRQWARNIHPDVEKLICQILEKKKYPEQAYRSCMGVLSLTKKVGDTRLINACGRALEYGVCNYKIVESILEKGLDKSDEPPYPDATTPPHNNIRGKDYYQ